MVLHREVVVLDGLYGTRSQVTERNAHTTNVIFQVVELSDLAEVNTLVKEVDDEDLVLHVVVEVSRVLQLILVLEVEDRVVAGRHTRALVKLVEVVVEEWLHEPRIKHSIVTLQALAASHLDPEDLLVHHARLGRHAFEIVHL